MGALLKFLCFAIFLHEVTSNPGDETVVDILSNMLDFISVTVSNIARKALETKLEINANLNGSNTEHDQDSNTSSDLTESRLIKELLIIKKAISAEKMYVRNIVNSLEKKFDDNRRNEVQRDNSSDQTDLRSRMLVIETEFKSFESLATKMEQRIYQVETNLDSLESVINFLENRTDSMGENLEYVDKITGKLERRIESVEEENKNLENKLELVGNDVESVETMTTMIKERVDSVESTIDFVELASDGFDKRIDTMESTITKMTEAANKKVSFFAQYEPPLNNQAGIFSKNRFIPFKHVIYNEGSGLNTTSGTFIVPISGVYKFVFFVEGFNYDGENTCPDAVVQLFVNGMATTSTAVAEAWNLKQTIQSGNQYISYLMRGQEVGVATASVCEKHTIVGYRTSFSGVLLH